VTKVEVYVQGWVVEFELDDDQLAELQCNGQCSAVWYAAEEAIEAAEAEEGCEVTNEVKCEWCSGSGSSRWPIAYYCGHDGSFVGSSEIDADAHAVACGCVPTSEYGPCPFCKGARPSRGA